VTTTNTFWQLAGRLCDRAVLCLLLLLVCMGNFVPRLAAQKSESSSRKVVYRVEPKYPPDLKKNGIGGVVKLAIVIAPRGTVEKVSPIGGNAALVDASVLAVKQWKYVPADSSTTAEIQFNFVPGR